MKHVPQDGYQNTLSSWFAKGVISDINHVVLSVEDICETENAAVNLIPAKVVRSSS